MNAEISRSLEPNAHLLVASVLRKSGESARTKEEFFAKEALSVSECARAMANRFAEGAHLFALGNGGSLCDAQHMALEFMHPIIEKREPLPAMALGSDAPFLSAIGNDEDFAVAATKQIRALGKPGDIALAISTSGKSASLVRALLAAREQGMLTIGFAGKDGGKFPDLCDFCFTVPSFNVHRIQETHETLMHILWDLVHIVRGEEDVT